MANEVTHHYLHILCVILSSVVCLHLQLVSEQQESRPLLSPSIDDFLCETKCHGAARLVTSNTAVLSSTLDLLDLSEPGERRNSKQDKKSPLLSRGDGPKNMPHRKKTTDETELIQVDVEQTVPCPHTPERVSLDSVNIASPLEKWEELNVHTERNSSRKWKLERRGSSKNSSSELLWSIDCKTQSEPPSKSSLEVNTIAEAEPALAFQGRLSKERFGGGALLSRNQSLEEEFERAKEL
ncbi:unnamed protein product [Oncorhynchus mykiss]|uniref:Uncharacterized protein n=1 Tax=Oncorhynchus mykiss TaxID=8022 RepID=A0A060XQS5_ONCMY|nr:unnamed protein product [Oncorhynchus mykiss]